MHCKAFIRRFKYLFATAKANGKIQYLINQLELVIIRLKTNILQMENLVLQISKR